MSPRFVVPVLLTVVLLAGCEARFDSNLSVRDDESGTFSIELSLDDELREALEEQGGQQFLNFSDQLGEVPPSWTVTDFTDGVFQGVRVSTEFSDFADLGIRVDEFDQQLAESELALPETFRTLGLSRDGDLFRFQADLSQMAEGLDALSGQEVAGLDLAGVIDTIFTIRFIVILPGEIVEHNADSIDESTLVWQITSSDTTRVLTAVSDAGSGPSVTSVVGVAVVVGVVVAALVFIIARSRRRRAEELAAARLIDSGNS